MTKPIEQIIPRNEPEEIKQNLSFLKNILDELVNYGSIILASDLQKKDEVRGEESIAPIMLLRHALDLMDSISILVEKGSGDVPKVLLRSLFETILGIEYILKGNSRNRSLAFFVSDIIRQVELIKKLNTSTAEGTALNEIINTEIGVDTQILSRSFDLDLALKNKLSVLEKEYLSPIYQEYLRLRNKKVRHPAWYQYFGGPTSIFQLAKLLNRQGEYTLLYSKWSGAVHGTDIYLGKITSTDVTGMVEIEQIRNFGDVQEVSKYSAIFSLRLLTLYVNARLPELKKSHSNWYKTIKPKYEVLIKKNLIKKI